jgi:hypothetical protein
MKRKDEIATTLAEAAVVTALIGLGGAALPLAATAYGVWRFMPDKLADAIIRGKDGKPGSD